MPAWSPDAFPTRGHDPDILPNHPMIVEWLSAKLRIEPACGGIVWIDIHAHSKGILLKKPGSDCGQECAGYAAAARFLVDIDPLQFTVAGVAAGPMPGNESHDFAVGAGVIDGDKGCASGQSLPGRVFSLQIPSDAGLPISRGLPRLRAHCRHGSNVAIFGRLDPDCHRAPAKSE